MNDFSKFQWSQFSPDHTEQYVIRCDEQVEFDKLVTTYKTKLPQTKAFPDDTGTVATPPSNVQEGLGVCDKCGAPNKLSRLGKKYCSALCWKK
jgi:hypothetical protein